MRGDYSVQALALRALVRLKHAHLAGSMIAEQIDKDVHRLLHGQGRQHGLVHQARTLLLQRTCFGDNEIINCSSCPVA